MPNGDTRMNNYVIQDVLVTTGPTCVTLLHNYSGSWVYEFDIFLRFRKAQAYITIYSCFTYYY